jgi:hypothetical protein
MMIMTQEEKAVMAGWTQSFFRLRERRHDHPIIIVHDDFCIQ